jgi:NADH-quinone oxidoreductase subunit F
MIERLGVDIETGKRLGGDFTLESLRESGYEAVFLGIGAPGGIGLAVPGEECRGVTEAIDFLREYNLRGSAEVGREVVVIGGGNAAIDAARTAKRLGAKSVRIIYRRTRNEMPAYAEEIAEAQAEGIEIVTLAAPVEIITENERVAAVKCQRMSLGEFDRSGRRGPVPVEGSEFEVNVDQVIAAIGQFLELGEILNGAKPQLTRRNYIDVNPLNGQSSVPWLFCGGDAATGPASVTEAVGAGEKAAVGIDEFLTGEKHAFWREYAEVGTFFDPEADPVSYARVPQRTVPVSRRKGSFTEVEVVMSEKNALREAKRCLRCDYREEM